MNQNGRLNHVLAIILVGSIVGGLQGCKTRNDNQYEETITQDLISDIDKAIEAAYKVWYVGSGSTPDFSDYSKYYTSTAIFQDVKKDTLLVVPLTDNVMEFQKAFRAGHIRSFDEREIGSETVVLGNVAHRVSHHIYYINNSDSVTKRGTNSIQLLKTEGKWKIQTILRQIESDQYQLPDKFDSFR